MISIQEERIEVGYRYKIPRWDVYLDYLESTGRGEGFRPSKAILTVDQDVAAMMGLGSREIALKTFNLSADEVRWMQT